MKANVIENGRIINMIELMDDCIIYTESEAIDLSVDRENAMNIYIIPDSWLLVKAEEESFEPIFTAPLLEDRIYE